MDLEWPPDTRNLKWTPDTWYLKYIPDTENLKHTLTQGRDTKIEQDLLSSIHIKGERGSDVHPLLNKD